MRVLEARTDASNGGRQPGLAPAVERLERAEDTTFFEKYGFLHTPRSPASGIRTNSLSTLNKREIAKSNPSFNIASVASRRRARFQHPLAFDQAFQSMQALRITPHRLTGLALASQLRASAAALLSTSCNPRQALPALAEEAGGGGGGSDQPLHRALLLDAAGTLLSPSEPAAEVPFLPATASFAPSAAATPA